MRLVVYDMLSMVVVDLPGLHLLIHILVVHGDIMVQIVLAMLVIIISVDLFLRFRQLSIYVLLLVLI